MPHITIIGGGITGLATAFYLQKKSREEGLALTYSLLEAAPRLGGKVVTEENDGFILEGGPDSFITHKPGGSQLCRDLGLTDQIIPTNDDKRAVFILNKGRLTPFPGGIRLTIPTELSPFIRSNLISWPGKLRMGLDYLLPRRKDSGDESLADFVRRRFGQEAVDKFAGPIMAGIYVADPERLSMQSTFPNFVEMEQQHGSLIKAMRQLKKKQIAAPVQPQPKAMFHTLRGGLGTLVAALQQQLEGDVRCNCRVTQVESLASGYQLTLNNAETLQSDGLVFATPAYIAANLLQPLAPDLAKALHQIRYVSSATISLGYRRAEVQTEHNFAGFGFIVPKTEGRKIIACTWTSTKFNHRAPEDGVLIRVFVGGYQQEDLVALADEALLELVCQELAEIMQLKAPPILHKIFRWKKGNPQYDVGHLERVGHIEALADELLGLHLAGSAYYGVGLPDCIKSAQNVVDKIGQTFQAKHKQA